MKPNTETRGRLLVADDEPSVLRTTQGILEREGYEVLTVDSAEHAIAALKEQNFDLILVDYKMPGNENLELIKLMAGQYCHCPVIVFTGYPSLPSAIEAFRLNVFDYILKPMDIPFLCRRINEAVDKHRLEKALRVSEEKYRTLAESIKEGLFIVQDGRLQFVNRALSSVSGYSVDDLVGMRIELLLTSEDGPCVKRLCEGSDLSRPHELQLRHKDGKTIVPVSVSCSVASYDDRPAAMGTVVDLTELKKTTLALNESERRLDLLLKAAHVGSWDWNVLSGEVRLNGSWRDILGYRTEETTQTLEFWENLRHPDDSPAVKKRLEEHFQGRSPTFESRHRIRSALGQWVWVLERGQVVKRDEEGNVERFSAVFLDISSMKKAEQASNALARLEATATLARGISHEYNNLMHSILGNAAFAAEEIGPNAVATEYIKEIQHAAERAGILARQLLAFARGGKCRSQTTQLNEIVLESIGKAKSKLSSGVKIVDRLDPALRPIAGDSAQMRQMIDSILNNSIEAIEGTGLITISTENLTVDEDFAAEHPGLLPGPCVAVTVEDTGCGMDEEQRSRAFEPFFTTKFCGRGLGLSAVYGIVKNHDGYISLQSEKGKGTSVKVYFSAREVGSLSSDKRASSNLPTGNETVLVIDDDPMVIEVTGRLLKRLGYRILTAANGKEALSVVDKTEEIIELVLLDLGMPVMNGEQVFPLLKEKLPETRIILCSGYEMDHTAQKLMNQGADEFLQKPFRIADFAKTVRRVLDQGKKGK